LVAEFFASLANPTRVSMFCAMRDGKKTVSEIAEKASVTLQNASQHLRVMRDKGAVIAERDGQHVLYAIADPRLIEGSRLIRDVLAEQLNRRAGSVNGLTIGG
jgi:DNA-binding transcriptional ArsR family regulator